jgi:hypothetical protein
MDPRHQPPGRHVGQCTDFFYSTDVGLAQFSAHNKRMVPPLAMSRTTPAAAMARALLLKKPAVWS